MKFVEMTHPKSKRTATVPESAVPQHAKAGWQLVKPAEKPAEK